MKETLIRDINGYIAYLNSTGLVVSVHGRHIGGLLQLSGKSECVGLWQDLAAVCMRLGKEIC